MNEVLMEIASKELMLIYLIGVMIVVGVLKEYNLFHFQFLTKLKSKRLSVVLFSIFSGILPVPGRVTVSAGLLDTIATKDPEKRKYFGITDYLATHHFYFWSPLEKTVILPLAALGFTWGEWMSYFIYPLVAYLVFLFYYIYKNIPEEAIEFNFKEEFNLKEFSLYTLPVFIAIGLVIFYNPVIVFGLLGLYYAGYMFNQLRDIKITIDRLNSFINWKLVGILAIVLALSVTGSHFVEGHEGFIEQYKGALIIIIASLIFGATLITGEEDVYAALVAAIIPALGPNYLLFLWFAGYFAYSISPFHDCIWIGTGYFGTPIKWYYKVISKLLGVLTLIVGLWYLIRIVI